jgi:GNAT superfamily N-acetyltransferase
MISIRRAVTEDATTIRTLAEAVWWPTYTPILKREQIEYMLESMYDVDLIEQQIDTGEQTYIILQLDDVPTGFAAFSPRKENPAVYKLHKLYCLPAKHRKGLGKQLLEKVEEMILNEGKTILELNVNRFNPAKGFYEKMGFIIAYEEDIDIGSGYFMNDYVMRKALSRQA